MRDYSKVSGAFWTGKTGKSMRGDLQKQVVAMYLMTSPHANMIGVFHCPLIYIAHETGSPIEGASKALNDLCEGGFCSYDHETETVWVHEMARFQIGDELLPRDKRIGGIQKMADFIAADNLKAGFFERYKTAFLLVDNKPLTSPLQAPLKPEAGTEAEAEAEAGTGTEAEKNKPTKSIRLTQCPKDFAVSQAVRDWAEKNEFTKYLDLYLDEFMTYVAKKAPKYANWDRAFMDCVRKDWGSIRAKSPSAVNGSAWKADDNLIYQKSVELKVGIAGLNRAQAVQKLERVMSGA